MAVNQERRGEKNCKKQVRDGVIIREIIEKGWDLVGNEEISLS